MLGVGMHKGKYLQVLGSKNFAYHLSNAMLTKLFAAVLLVLVLVMVLVLVKCWHW